jgi:hypothetical protein
MVIAVMTYGVVLSIAVPTSPAALTAQGRSPAASLLLLAVAVVLATVVCGALAAARGLVTRERASCLPGGLRPAMGGLLLTRGTLQPRHLLAMIVDLERRGLLTSAPDTRRPGEWVFTLCATPGPTITRAEFLLLRLLFPYSEQGSVRTLTARLNEDSARALREALAEESHRLGLVRSPLHRRAQGLVFASTIMLAAAAPFAVPRLTPWTFNWVEAAAIVVLGLGVALGAAPAFTKCAGERVKNLLVREVSAEALPGPGCLARRPAWVLALDAAPDPPRPTAGAGAPHPGDCSVEGPLEATPYHRDPGFRARWDAQVGARMGVSTARRPVGVREESRWHLVGEAPAPWLRAVAASAD